MKARTRLAASACFALFFLMTTCFYPQAASASSTADAVQGIKIHWRVVSNGLGASPKCISEVELRNDSQTTLPASGWALYYNFELAGEPQPKDAPFALKHINGDLFRVEPTSHFVPLVPGKSVKFQIISDNPILSYSIAPGGFFFVLSSEDAAKPTIIPVPESSVTRFIPPSEMSRGKEDALPYSTPELRYRENQALTQLPAAQLPTVFPTPLHYYPLKGSYTLTAQTVIYSPAQFNNEADYLEKQLEPLFGAKLLIVNDPPKPLPASLISLIRRPSTAKGDDPDPNPEGYTLLINPDFGITIASSTSAGLFNGIQSLREMLPVELLNKQTSQITLPSAQIVDRPRFYHRGLMLDVARNFQTKAEVLKLLDAMAYYKLNVLHFHLVDDEGWRIEIAGLPELTSVGGRRGFTPEGQPVEMLQPTLDSGPFADSTSSHGSGYYTRADFIEILHYANARHIEVIPEIEGPGHARASIQSMLVRYRHLMAANKPAEAREYLLTDPDDQSKFESVQGYGDNVMNVCIPSTLHFMDKVFTEIAAIYKEADIPLKRVHVGGDEVPHGAWEHTEACQKLPEAERNPQALEHSYMASLGKMLNKLGARPTAWEEAVLTHSEKGPDTVDPILLTDNAIPVAWRNIWGDTDEDNAYRMANAGYDVVMAEASILYLDMLHSKEPEEPGTYWAAFIDTRQTFEFTPSNLYNAARADTYGHPMNPCKDFQNRPHLTEEGSKHIIGIQGAVWSERVLGPELMEYFYFPRALAVAERAWAPEPKWESACDGLFSADFATDWNRFANQLGQRELTRLAALDGGVNFRIPPPGAVIENGQLKANTNFPGLTIRYTTDGSEPTATSTLYSAPVKLSGTVKLKTFDAKGRGSRTSTLTVK